MKFEIIKKYNPKNLDEAAITIELPNNKKEEIFVQVRDTQEGWSQIYLTFEDVKEMAKSLNAHINKLEE